MDPFLHTGLSISDSLKSVRKSVLIYETIIISPQRKEKNMGNQKCDKMTSGCGFREPLI